MPNTNVFKQVVHEKKIFKDLSNFPPFWLLKWPPKGPDPSFEQI